MYSESELSSQLSVVSKNNSVWKITTSEVYIHRMEEPGSQK